jgi:hypothetical protein
MKKEWKREKQLRIIACMWNLFELRFYSADIGRMYFLHIQGRIYDKKATCKQQAEWLSPSETSVKFYSVIASVT